MEPLIKSKLRIESIDVLRGIVMIIMALDHVRDYFHITANTDNPLNLATTTPLLYFTRWVTHFCAPVFVFLSGASVYLQSLRKTKKELSAFLIKRGLWLIFIEVVVITFVWTFNPFYNILILQVIWAIGISMVLLGLLIYLPFNFILLLGIIISFAHNLLDFPEASPDFKHNFLIDLLHSGRFSPYPYLTNHFVLVVYPFLPWTGLMMLGYCAGIWFTPKYSAAQRRSYLITTGMGLIMFFIALRFKDGYGDPDAWSVQHNTLFTLLSFFNVHKYPPSLLYNCITIGPSLLFLAFIEKIKNRFTDTVCIYGRVAFFYYVLHIYLIHLLATAAFFIRGHSLSDVADVGTRLPFLFVAPGEGYGLAAVYAVWISVVVSLYPLCKWYDGYKTRHKEKWWLSYL